MCNLVADMAGMEGITKMNLLRADWYVNEGWVAPRAEVCFMDT